MADVHEREHWDDYQAAYDDMIRHTSTEAAPWYVVPADHKWFTRLIVAEVLAATLLDIDPQYPTLSEDQRAELADAHVARSRRAEPRAPAPSGGGGHLHRDRRRGVTRAAKASSSASTDARAASTPRTLSSAPCPDNRRTNRLTMFTRIRGSFRHWTRCGTDVAPPWRPFVARVNNG